MTIRGAASSSHRWPTLNEMVRNFQVGAILTRANAGLRPERAVSAEGALAISGDKWHASAGGFWTVVEDAIANVTIQFTPTIIRERRNAGEAHAKGLELDFDVHPISMLTPASLGARRRFAVPRIARARARGQMAAAGAEVFRCRERRRSVHRLDAGILFLAWPLDTVRR